MPQTADLEAFPLFFPGRIIVIVQAVEVRPGKLSWIGNKFEFLHDDYCPPFRALVITGIVLVNAYGYCNDFYEMDVIFSMYRGCINSLYLFPPV